MKYYTTTDVSNILGFNVKHIQKLIRDKKLIGYRISGRYLISDVDLKTYIEKFKV